jgi:DNA-binding MarR family transcriptional regulator
MHTYDQFVSTLSEWSEVYMHNSMRNLFHYSKESGLSISQIGALFRVFHKGNSAVSGISEELGVTGAAASQMLERMVQQGLILRSENPTDRRMKQIVLTDKGRQVLQESVDARQSWFVDLASALSEDEKGLVVTALNILIDKANQLDLNLN